MIKAVIVDFGLTIRLLNVNNSEYRKLEISGSTARMRGLLNDVISNGYGKYGHLAGTGPYLPEDVLIILSQNKIRYVLDESSERIESFDVPKGALS